MTDPAYGVRIAAVSDPTASASPASSAAVTGSSRFVKRVTTPRIVTRPPDAVSGEFPRPDNPKTSEAFDHGNSVTRRLEHDPQR
jgi:hypothetical protein